MTTLFFTPVRGKKKGINKKKFEKYSYNRFSKYAHILYDINSKFIKFEENKSKSCLIYVTKYLKSKTFLYIYWLNI